MTAPCCLRRLQACRLIISAQPASTGATRCTAGMARTKNFLSRPWFGGPAACGICAGCLTVTRIDHFRGFESYWAIPPQEKTAVNGTWKKGPGAPFFKRIREELGELPLIAEDLGIITPAVTRLRQSLKMPGMKILQFAFDGSSKNPYLPHNYTDPNCVVYTGTHDNNTTNGWFYGAETGDSYAAPYSGVYGR